MNSDSERYPVIDIAVAILQRRDGRVLVADRPAGKPWSGYWEFPGGKVEPGETVRQTLDRELHEEIAIEAETVRPWITVTHRYDDRQVRLHCHRITAWHGDPRGCEGQRIAWVDPASPEVQPLLPANDRILEALYLPPVYAITAAGEFGEAEFLTRLERALQRGIRLIQVREPGFAPEPLASFVHEVVKRAHEYGARVLLNGDPAPAREGVVDGVHLPARQLMRLEAAPEVSLWSASCHDADELARAAALGADFAVLSPVLATPSHPGAAGIGWQRFAELLRNCPLPVYALGGMRDELLDTAMQHGAHGIAMLRGAWPA